MLRNCTSQHVIPALMYSTIKAVPGWLHSAKHITLHNPAHNWTKNGIPKVPMGYCIYSTVKTKHQRIPSPVEVAIWGKGRTQVDKITRNIQVHTYAQTHTCVCMPAVAKLLYRGMTCKTWAVCRLRTGHVSFLLQNIKFQDAHCTHTNAPQKDKVTQHAQTDARTSQMTFDPIWLQFPQIIIFYRRP